MTLGEHCHAAKWSKNQKVLHIGIHVEASSEHFNPARKSFYDKRLAGIVADIEKCFTGQPNPASIPGKKRRIFKFCTRIEPHFSAILQFQIDTLPFRGRDTSL